MAFVDINGHEIFYQVHSHIGTPFILIMGLGGSSDGWKFQVEEFQKKYSIITPDNRGAGRSAKPDEPYSMAQFADDIAAIFEQEGIDQAIVMGASMGGLIAQEFYHKHPDKVKSLILCCTGVGAGDPEFIMPDPKVLEVLSTVFPEHEKEQRRFLGEYIDIFYHHSYYARNPGILDWMHHKRTTKGQPEYANKRQLESCLTHTPNAPRLKEIKAPTLVIHAEDDIIWPLANAIYLADNIEDAELYIMKDAGHMFFVEKPEEFNKAVLNFLESKLT
ncbi:MAG: alpha/beta hydrolase [Gammaproteobacteria bacterium]|nr:MAG: alpha/beta hydrolase [Gammaproteobacteria bacterium]